MEKASGIMSLPMLLAYFPKGHIEEYNYDLSLLHVIQCPGMLCRKETVLSTSNAALICSYQTHAAQVENLE
jgi:hypothetical protein